MPRQRLPQQKCCRYRNHRKSEAKGWSVKSALFGVQHCAILQWSSSSELENKREEKSQPGFGLERVLKIRLVSGHDFSRTERAAKKCASAPQGLSPETSQLFFLAFEQSYSDYRPMKDRCSGSLPATAIVVHLGFHPVRPIQKMMDRSRRCAFGAEKAARLKSKLHGNERHDFFADHVGSGEIVELE
jgi:hypothetical protein